MFSYRKSTIYSGVEIIFCILGQPLSSLRLIDKEAGEIIVEVNVISENQIQVSQGRFYTHKGDLLEITPKFWRIRGVTMSGNVIDRCGGAVAIG